MILVSLKREKHIINRELTIKRIVLVFHVTLVICELKQLDGMKIIIKLKFKNHPNIFKAT